jgi:hypothetical protein
MERLEERIPVEAHIINPPLEYREQRERMLLAEADNRTPLEKLFDVFLRTRLTRYRPDEPPQLRQDIICLSCGYPYRPDDVMDAENVFLCGSCMLTRKDTEAKNDSEHSR